MKEDVGIQTIKSVRACINRIGKAATLKAIESITSYKAKLRLRKAYCEQELKPF